MLLKGEGWHYLENKGYICAIIKYNRHEKDKYTQFDIPVNYTLRI